MSSMPLRSYAASASLCAVLTTIAIAQAKPPQTGGVQAPRAPLVGRVRTRDGLLDLTVESVGAGGPAQRVGRGWAEVIADVEPRGEPAHDERAPAVLLDLAE